MNWNDLMWKVLDLVLPTVLAAIATGGSAWLAAMTTKAFMWLSSQASHVKNEYARGVLMRLSALVGEKVLAYENTEIEVLKEQVAAGKVKKEDLPALLAAMKAKLLEDVKRDASAQNLLQMAVKVFAGDEGALAQWLSDLVETHVSTLPPSGLQTSKDGVSAPAVQKAAATPASPQ